MTWDNICDILIDGTAEEMLRVSCPDCGGVIRFMYNVLNHRANFDVICISCGSMCNSFLGPDDNVPPNCVQLFGSEIIMNKDAKLKQTA